MTEMKQEKKGKGGFWVARKAIDALIDKSATAEQICAYLVLARFNTLPSDKEVQYATSKAEHKYFPIFSSAGKTSLKTYLGFSPLKAKRVLQSLVDMRTKAGEKLVFSKDEWSKAAKSFREHIHLFGFDDNRSDLFHDTPLMIAKDEKTAIWFALNTFGEKRSEAIWFPNELIVGIGKRSRRGSLSQPLKTLCKLPRINDAAARFILLFYKNYDIEYNGYDPLKGLALVYSCRHLNDIGRMRLLQTTRFRFVCSKELEKNLAGEDGACGLPTQIIEHPLLSGLFYCKILVVDKRSLGSEASPYEAIEAYLYRVLYELDVKKTKSSYRPKREHGVAKMFENAIRNYGHSVADESKKGYFRFNRKYPVLAYDHESIAVLGVLCPRLSWTPEEVWFAQQLREMRGYHYANANERVRLLGEDLKNIESDVEPTL